jgi:hypothetical protein
MRFRVTSVGALVCCLALAVSACGGSKKPATAGGPRPGLPSGAADPCRLATPAQVKAAVGAPVASPLRSSVEGAGGTVLTCTWRGTADNPESVAELDVYPSTAAFDDARKTQSAAASGSGFRDLPGVVSGNGNAAFAGEQGIVWVRKGPSAFTVHWFDPKNALPATVAKGAALAKVVAARF